MNSEPQPNIALSGDEARILMAALRTTNIGAPMGITVNLYLALNAISQVQPPRVQTNQGTSNNEEL
jgi:hypothetical protein